MEELERDALQRAVVTFSVYHDAIEPAEISRLLCAEPHRVVRKGELIRVSEQQLRAARTGRWDVTTGWNCSPLLGQQIEVLLGKMTNDLAVWREIQQRFKTLVTVGGYFEDWTGGFFLPLTTLVALSERMLEIDFDLYANCSGN